MNAKPTIHLADKAAIASEFGRAAATYHQQAKLQSDCADRLLHHITALPISGTILEIGCGTGFVTQGLIQHFPQQPIYVTDLSAEMVQFCQSTVAIPPRQQALIRFGTMDGEFLTGEETYGLIVSNFVIQWFQHPAQSLVNWLARLQVGGWLCVTFPSCHSFAEWRSLCQELDLPFTANPLPDPRLLLEVLKAPDRQVDLQESTLPVAYANILEFFHSLKAIGANWSRTGRQLSIPQLRRLIHAEGRRSLPFIVHTHVATLTVKKL
jgi:malonyl-CoA O-methyltransferase